MPISILKRKLSNYLPSTIEGSYPNAAVLVPLIEQDGELQVVLTTRSKHLNSHAGEVAFPGGMQDETDNDLQHTALRESWEEIGLPKRSVSIIGDLDIVVSKAGIRVFPYVGIVGEPVDFEINPDEIEEVFFVPWQFFLDTEVDFFTIEHGEQSWQVPQYRYKQYHIWGLTAMIMVNLVSAVTNKNGKNE